MQLDDVVISPLTYVIHAAADSTTTAQLTQLQRFDQIVEGTRNVLNFSIASRVKRLLFISSGGAYGRQPDSMTMIPESFFGEHDTLSSSSAYGIAKRSAEHLCALYAESFGIQIVVARCFAFVGRDLPHNAHFAIGNFIRDALWSREIVVNGDGTPVRSYLDQRDLICWLLALLRDGKTGEAYNVGSDQAISILDLAHLVRDLVSPNKPVRILGKSIESTDRNCYVPDIRKIGVEFGLRPSISLEQSIIDMAESVSTNRS
jgi:dTDP-glucose 4,6-dehydratase